MSDAVAIDDPLGKIWREGLARIPSSDLAGELEHVRRLVAQLKATDEEEYCSDIVALGPLINRYQRRGRWIEEEQQRRAKFVAPIPDDRLPADWLDALRARADLGIFIINHWTETKLRKSGDHLVGHCPLHADSTASFHVWQGQGRYHCFGCEADGDIFDLVLAAAWVRDFVPAVQRVADWAHMPMPIKVAPVEIRGRATAAQMKRIHFLRGRIGITDTSDLPTQISAQQAADYLMQLEGEVHPV